MEESVPPIEQSRPWWKLRVSPPNPFYLLSAASFLHSTGIWAQQQGRDLPAEMRLGLIGAYLALMTLTVLIIVRLWKQWDDSRSILLVILLLFAELALTFDDAVLQDAQRGSLLLLAGFGLSVLVSEALFHGLRMRFPARFRIPYYVQLAMIFLYPLVLVEPAKNGDRVLLTERLFGFSWLAAITMLLLIPAIHRGRKGLDDTGTPWRWPMYPWPAFVFLGLCLIVRTYAQCLSFDSVSMIATQSAINGLPSIFGPHFLAPFIFAIGILIYVGSRTSMRPRLGGFALSVFPIAALLASFPGDGGNVAYREFAILLTQRWVAPPLMMLAASAVFFAVATWWKDERAAVGLIATAITSVFIGPETISVASLRWPPHSSSIAALTAASVFMLLRSRTSPWFALSVTLATAWAWTAGVLRFPEATVALQFVFAGVLLGGLLFQDRWAPVLLRIAAFCVMVFAAMFTIGIEPPHVMVLVYLFHLMSVAVAVAWLRKQQRFRDAALVTAMFVEIHALRLLYVWVDDVAQWHGLPNLALAVALLVIGFHISAWKAGALARLRGAH